MKQSSNLNSSRIAFLIPVYNHNPEPLIKEIVSIYKKSKILVLDDGLNFSCKISAVEIVKNTENVGLARSLVYGYSILANRDVDYIVRVDPDREYPLYPVKDLIIKLSYTLSVSGAFVQLQRNISSNGFVDSVFHNLMGFIEGLMLLKKPMVQHSPGLQIYKKNILINMLPILQEFVDTNNLRWGLDLATLRLGKLQGDVISYIIKRHSWRERRAIKKILDQTISALKVLDMVLNIQPNWNLELEEELVMIKSK